MKIREKDEIHTLEVYGLYWFDGLRHFYAIPYEGYPGFNAFREDECELVDPVIGADFVLVKSGSNRDMLIHKALIKDDLLDAVIDHDPDAMKEFKRRLAEGDF